MVTYDVSDPDFPHGTPAGRERGCPCDACRRAAARRAAINELRRLEGVIGPDCRVDAAPAKKHIRTLQAASPGLGLAAIARCAGVTPSAINELMRKDRSTMKARVRDGVLAVTAAAAAAEHQGLVPAAPLTEAIRRTQAAGWSMTWWMTAINHNLSHVYEPNQKYLDARVARRIHAVLDRIGDEFATPENSGQSQSGITYAMRSARKLGYHPPAHYDADGNLEGRLIPGHPWAEADTECGLLIAIAARLVRPGWSPEEEPYHAIVARFEPTYGDAVYEEKVQRAAKALRVGPKTPDREENAARVRDVLAEVDAGTLDVVRAAVDLNLATWGNGNATVPRDHPAIADLVKKDDEGRAKRAAAYKDRQRALKKEQKLRKRAVKRAQAEGKAA